jgi:hypothetical protein
MSFQAGRRERIFADINGKPTLWNQLWRGLMLHFGKSYQRLSTRGGRLVVATTSSSAAVVVSSAAAQPVQVKEKQNVYQTSVVTVNPSQIQQVERTAQRMDQVIVSGVNNLYVGVQRLASGTSVVVYQALQKLLPTLEAQFETRPTIKAIQNDIIEAKEMLIAKAQMVKSVAQDPTQAVESLVESKSPVVATPIGWWNVYVGPVIKRGMDTVTAVLARRWALDEINFVLARRRLDVYAVKG